MAVWRRGEGVTRRVCCMERHTAKYSEIQPNSIQPAIQPCRACRGSGAWPGCAQAAVHAAMGAGYRPTPSVTPSSPTGTLSACVSVAPFGAIQQEHHTAYHTAVLLHTCDSPRHAFPPAPYSHTAPYSAIQRCMSIQLYSTIQHTAHTTPLRSSDKTCLHQTWLSIAIK